MTELSEATDLLIERLRNLDVVSPDLLNLAERIAELEQQRPDAPPDPSTPAEERAEERVAATRLDAEECRPAVSGGLFAALHPDCSREYVEQLQLLRTQLMLHRTRYAAELDVRAIAVMSTHRGEGKSFTATNLAANLALSSGKDVLLIDANPEGGQLPTGIESRKPGLAQALAQPEQWDRSVYRARNSSLHIMPRGKSQSQSLDFAPLPRLLAQFQRHFEWVILDGTSFATSPDAQWLSSVADGTLLVVQGGAAKFSALNETLVRIPEDRMVGVVFNERPATQAVDVNKRRFRLRLRLTGI